MWDHQAEELMHLQSVLGVATSYKFWGNRFKPALDEYGNKRMRL